MDWQMGHVHFQQHPLCFTYLHCVLGSLTETWSPPGLIFWSKAEVMRKCLSRYGGLWLLSEQTDHEHRVTPMEEGKRGSWQKRQGSYPIWQAEGRGTACGHGQQEHASRAGRSDWRWMGQKCRGMKAADEATRPYCMAVEGPWEKS